MRLWLKKNLTQVPPVKIGLPLGQRRLADATIIRLDFLRLSHPNSRPLGSTDSVCSEALLFELRVLSLVPFRLRPLCPLDQEDHFNERRELSVPTHCLSLTG